jgi:hypothetical protein
LTRRANHRHSDIIAKVSKPAPATAAGFSFLEIGRRRASEQATLFHAFCVVAHASPFEPPDLNHIAGTRERAGRRRALRVRPRPPCSQGIGFAPQMIAPTIRDHAAHFLFARKHDG